MCGSMRQPGLASLVEAASTLLDREVTVSRRAEQGNLIFSSTPGMRLNVLAYQRSDDDAEYKPVITAMWFGYGSDFSGFNARYEGIATKPTWAEDFARRRCIVPTMAFKEAGVQFGRRDDDVMFFGAIFSKYQTQNIRHCSVITRNATDTIASFHNRMPLPIDTEHADLWLNREHPLTAAERLEMATITNQVRVVG